MDYTTPGSAVSDVVQQIIDRRRNLGRQSLLDQLGVEKYKTDVANNDRDFGLRQEAEARAGKMSESEMAARKFNMVRQKASDLPFGEMDVTDDQQSDPDLFKYLMETGRIRKEDVKPSVSYGTDFQPPADATPEQLDSYAQQLEAQGPQEGRVQLSPTQTGRSIYTGSDKYQEQQDQRKRIEALGQNADFFGNDPLKMILAANMAGLNPPAAALPTTDTIVGPTGRTIQTIHGRGGDSITHLPFGPQANATNGKALYQVELDGQHTSAVFTPNEADEFIAKNPAAILRRGNPVTPPKPQDIIPSAFTSQLRQARANPSSARRQEQVASVMAGIKSAAMQRGVPPEVVDTASALSEDMAKFRAAGKPVPTVEDYVKGGFIKAAPEEVNKLKTILPFFLEP